MMFSVLRRPTLSRLMKATQKTHRSTIYSKPPKERIGPVVGLNIFINSCVIVASMDRYSWLFDCLSSRDCRNVFLHFFFTFVTWLLNHEVFNYRYNVWQTNSTNMTKSVFESQHLQFFTLLPLMWGTQANIAPQPAEWERCFIHFLSISQCEALASVKDPMMEQQHSGQCLCHDKSVDLSFGTGTGAFAKACLKLGIRKCRGTQGISWKIDINGGCCYSPGWVTEIGTSLVLDLFYPIF